MCCPNEWPHQRSKAPEVMVSRRPPNPIRKGRPEQIPALHSPLEKTPHNAGVVGDTGEISATGAYIEMAAPCGSTTTGNGPEHLDLRPGQRCAIAFPKPTACDADDVGHLPGWLSH